MGTYRDIPFAFAHDTSNGTGHHYISDDNPGDQWDVTFYPHGDSRRPGGDPFRTMPHVRVRVLDSAGKWQTRAIVPTGAERAL